MNICTILHIEKSSGGALCCGDRLVTPPPLRKAVLNELHTYDLGVEAMKDFGSTGMLVTRNGCGPRHSG